MSRSISNLAVALSLNSRGFSAGAASAVRSLDTLQAKAGQTSSRIADMLSVGVGFGMFNAAAGALSNLGSGMTNMAKRGISLAASAEQNAISFEVMLGSAAKAQTTLASLAKLAAETPFQSPEVVAAARSLIAFGSTAEGVTGELRAIGDIAAGVGAPLGEIAELYGKARTQGTLFAEDINQLTGRGINVISEFAKQLGVSDAQVKKLASNGQIGFANLARAFQDMTGSGGKFAGLMAKQSQSLAGLWSTLNDNVDASVSRLAEWALKSIDVKGGMESISIAVQALAEVGISSISAGFANSSISAKNFGTVAVDALEAVALAGAHLADTAVNIGTSFQGASATFAGMAADAVSWIDFEKHKWAEDMYIAAKRDLALATKAAETTFDASAAVQQRFADVRAKMAQMQAAATNSTGFDGGGGGDFGDVSQAVAAADAMNGKFRSLSANAAGWIGQVMQANSAGVESLAKSAADKLAKMADDARQIAEDIKEPWEKLGDEIDRIAQLEAAGLLTAGQAEKAVAKASDQFGGPRGTIQPRELAALERRFTAGMPGASAESKEDKRHAEAIKLYRAQVKAAERTAQAIEAERIVSIPV